MVLVSHNPTQAAEKRMLPESIGVSSFPIDLACLSARCITNGSRVELYGCD